MPCLSDLRRSAGQEAYELSTVDRVRKMVAEGLLPSPGLCVVSQRPTQEKMYFTIACETPEAVGGYSSGWLMVFRIFSPLLARLARREQPKLLGREIVVRVPLSISADCQPAVRKMSSTRLRELLGTVPAYAQLLQEYPCAQIQAG